MPFGPAGGTAGFERQPPPVERPVPASAVAVPGDCVVTPNRSSIAASSPGSAKLLRKNSECDVDCGRDRQGEERADDPECRRSDHYREQSNE